MCMRLSRSILPAVWMQSEFSFLILYIHQNQSINLKQICIQFSQRKQFNFVLSKKRQIYQVRRKTAHFHNDSLLIETIVSLMKKVAISLSIFDLIFI